MKQKYPGEMTPLELAKYIVRSDVEYYEDPVPHIMASHRGIGGPGYDASIGGSMWSEKQHGMFGNVPSTFAGYAMIGDPIKKIPNTRILVSEAQGKIVNQVFPVAEIVRMVQKEKTQASLFSV